MPDEYPLHADCSPEHRPYVLWFETLPSGDTAKVFIWPRKHDAAVALHWNGQINRADQCRTKEQAEQRGWELHRQVLAGQLSD